MQTLTFQTFDIAAIIVKNFRFVKEVILGSASFMDAWPRIGSFCVLSGLVNYFDRPSGE
jgi:hypothetical protein